MINRIIFLAIIVLTHDRTSFGQEANQTKTTGLFSQVIHLPVRIIHLLQLRNLQINEIAFPEDLNLLISAGAEPFIILGEPAAEGELPYQAYLISSKNNSNRGALCGGSLIKPHWVLTAAHCVVDTDQTMVQMGSNDKKKMTYKEVSYMRIVHLLYNPITLYNDVALVRLPVDAEGPNIGLIALPAKNIGSLVDESVLASGFGLTMNTGNVPETLNKVELVVASNKECRARYGSLLILRSTLCATFSTMKGQSTCSGDSGGPLVYRANDTSRYLVGVTSFVSGKGCDSGELAGFARVSSFVDWIETNTKKYD